MAQAKRCSHPEQKKEFCHFEYCPRSKGSDIEKAETWLLYVRKGCGYINVQLMVRCPHCQRLTGTGIYTNYSSFKTMTLINCRVECSHCDNWITYNKRDIITEIE